MPVDPEKTEFESEIWGRKYYFCSEHCMRRFQEEPEIGYFSMEIGLKSEIPTYSGGLGVLAGDTIRSSADLRIPLVAITLLSRKGYLRQKLSEDGEQSEYPEEWDPSQYLDPLPAEVELRMGGREVRVRAWLYEYQSLTGGIIFVLFLDTNNEANAPVDRTITDYLYGGDERYRLKQEMVLGIGGARMLKALDLRVKRYHINEGHSSLLTMELLRDKGMDSDRVRDLCIFTTHTPVEAAMDRFSYDMVGDLLGDEFPLEVLKTYGGEDMLNMTRLALNLSKYVNGVSQTNMEYSNELSPGHHIRAVTNGVHSYTWTSPYFRELFDRYIRGWANEPGLLTRAEIIPNNEVWEAHMKSKRSLLGFVEDRTGIVMDAEKASLGEPLDTREPPSSSQTCKGSEGRVGGEDFN
jgi:starch phosphorylase